MLAKSSPLRCEQAFEVDFLESDAAFTNAIALEWRPGGLEARAHRVEGADTRKSKVGDSFRSSAVRAGWPHETLDSITARRFVMEWKLLYVPLSGSSIQV